MTKEPPTGFAEASPPPYVFGTAALPKVRIDYKTGQSDMTVPAMKAAVEGILTRADIRGVIPDRTLDRRLATGQPLTMHEADGILRLMRVVLHARACFGDARRGDMFMRLENPSLDNQVPMDMARSEIGAGQVHTILGRIEHGVFS
jgi:putative toxin-antitoxin system antitoxin component (TIGR02293 family)